MMRNRILFMVVAVSVGVAPTWLGVPGSIAWSQSSTTFDVTADAEASGWVLRETFDDNRISKLWKVYQSDPNCKVAETNKRMEFTAVRDARDSFAGYVGSDWWIDPNHNFTMKADFYHDLITYGGAWLSFGLTPNRDKPRSQYVSIGIGASSGFPSYWNEWKDGYEIQTDFTSRPKDMVTLYISYYAKEGVVYVSDRGYGSDLAWVAFRDIVQDRWRGSPLFVFLGGDADAAKIESGRLYIDNFVIESGVIVKEGQSGTKPDPNDPTSPPVGDVDVIGPAMIAPTVLYRSAAHQEFSAMVSLPREIRPEDVDLMESLVIAPGNLAALRQGTLVTLTGRTVVLGAFSTDELLAVTPDGPVDLQIVGRLRDGRTFGGAQRIAIR